MQGFKRILALSVSVFAVLFSAAAADAAPAPGFGEFATCPDVTVDPTITACATNVISSGRLKLGTKDTPITDPIKLVAGINVNGDARVGSFDGGRQRIPGGLIGMTGLDWLRFIYPFNLLQIYAEAQLAGSNPVSNITGDPTLRLKVRLDNALLNNDCYIASDSNPIVLNLTTGTTSPPPPNQPITGQPGTFSMDPNGIIRSTGIRFVDNAFATPAAQNCDLLALNLLVTALVNAQAGLPAPAGTNEAIQNASVAIAGVTSVYPPNGVD
jgi:hypothetical protein